MMRNIPEREVHTYEVTCGIDTGWNAVLTNHLSGLDTTVVYICSITYIKNLECILDKLSHSDIGDVYHLIIHFTVVAVRGEASCVVNGVHREEKRNSLRPRELLECACLCSSTNTPDDTYCRPDCIRLELEQKPAHPVVSI
jgi:hypothetical protein